MRCVVENRALEPNPSHVHRLDREIPDRLGADERLRRGRELMTFDAAPPPERELLAVLGALAHSSPEEHSHRGQHLNVDGAPDLL
jgi:hypothetical protein